MKKNALHFLSLIVLIGCNSAPKETTPAAGKDFSISDKKYSRQVFAPLITGTWKASEAWVHQTNLLGERNFYFTFLSNDSIKISEPERDWHAEGTWGIDQNENAIQWEMANPDESFKGKYDMVDGQLLISGKGFIGRNEFVSLRLEKQ